MNTGACIIILGIGEQTTVQPLFHFFMLHVNSMCCAPLMCCVIQVNRKSVKSTYNFVYLTLLILITLRCRNQLFETRTQGMKLCTFQFMTC